MVEVRWSGKGALVVVIVGIDDVSYPKECQRSDALRATSNEKRSST